MKKVISKIQKVSINQLIICGLIVITFLFYGQTLSFDFLTFDDDTFITKNDIVTSDNSSFGDCFKYKFKEHDYFPLTFLTFRILRVVFGLNPVFFHALNLILHIFNVIMIFFLAFKIFNKLLPWLRKPESWSGAIALLFSIHPLHVESVSWVIDLKDILFSLFYLMGILTYWNWLECRKTKFYILTILFALLSLLSKSTAITFIAILFWVDMINGEKVNFKMLTNKIPFLLLTLFGFYIFGLFTNPSATLSGITGETIVDMVPYFPDSIAGFPVIFQRLVLSSFRLFFWIFHSFFPFELNLFYTRTNLLNQYSVLLPALPFILIAFLFVAWFLRKKFPLIFTGIVFFFITISPALAKTDTGLSVFVPDRYMYLPVMGLLLILIGLVQKIKFKIAFIFLCSFFLFWSFKTISYLPVWKNSYSLYNYCLKIDPNNHVALLNRSMCYVIDGNEEKAFQDLDLFLKKFPNGLNVAPYINHGAILKNRGEFEKALDDFNYVLKIKPGNFQALLNRGNVFLAQNKLDEARTDFSSAYDSDSTNYTLNKNISSLYNKSGNHAVALLFAEKCLVVNDKDFDLLRVKGVSLFYLGRNKEALEIFTKVLENQKGLGEMWYFRSRARFIEKDFDGAYIDLKEARKLNAKIETVFEEMLKDSVNVN